MKTTETTLTTSSEGSDEGKCPRLRSTLPDIVFIGSKYVPIPMSEDEADRIPEEQEILDQVAEDRGKEFAEENEELILADAEELNLL